MLSTRLVPTTWLITLAVCLASATPALAQAPAKSYALLVGCADYDQDQLRQLKFTQNDILAFYRGLLDAGFASDNIVLMHDRQKKDYLPETKKIRRQLDLLLSRARGEDTVIVAFAGHGIQFNGESDSYFCPVDADLEDRKSLLSLTEVYDHLRECRARNKLLLVDACRDNPQSGLARSRERVKLESVTRPQEIELPKNIAALFSCSPRQQSFEHPELGHGIFFYHLVQGWQGAADTNTDGRLTLDELSEYVRDKTQAYAHLKLKVKQEPFRKIEGGGLWVLRKVTHSTSFKPSTTTPPRPIRSELEVEWNGTWWDASIIEYLNNKYRVHYTGWGAEWDEWVTEDRMRYNTPHPDQKALWVQWEKKWWAGIVLQTQGDRYRVHYLGWSSTWDEWVTRDRIHVPANR